MSFTARHGLFAGAALLLLGACETAVPDSGQGVGFSDYTQFELDRARREAELRGAPGPAGGAPMTGGSTASEGGISTAELRAAGITGGNSQPQPQVQPTGPTTAPTPATSNPGISDEQDFDAVASRESIESDAERRARQAAAYTQVEPTAVPNRPANTGPNIVEYALSAPNQRGQEMYSRSLLSGESRFQRNCAKYNSPDDAQRDFLRRGGPQRDPLGIDPDGDGFACGWDPSPFRAAAGRG